MSHRRSIVPAFAMLRAGACSESSNPNDGGPGGAAGGQAVVGTVITGQPREQEAGAGSSAAKASQASDFGATYKTPALPGWEEA